MILSVLGLWLGASNHCRLEEVAGLEFLLCNPHAEEAAHQEDDCQKDSCAFVEHAIFKSEQQQFTVAQPEMLLVPDLVAVVMAERPDISSIGSQELPASAEILPTAWRFVFRAAAPPRAPSVAS